MENILQWEKISIINTSLHKESSSTHTTISFKTDNTKLLHLRMRHVRFKKLHFNQSHMGNTLYNNCICSIFPQARQHRLKFSKSVTN